jgi:hypothetical protein
MAAQRPPLDPHPLSAYVAWAGGRNREPILSQLKELLPQAPGEVLELASGSGMHINFFAPHFKHLRFQPSDRDESVFGNIQRLRDEAGNTNVAAPIMLDLTRPETWPGEPERFAAIYCINLFQVAPVSIAEGMMRGASNVLRKEGCLLVYGPFKINGQYSTPSNEEFDGLLRSAGVPEWGLKDVEDLSAAARRHGLTLKNRLDMPANNFLLVFTRA